MTTPAPEHDRLTYATAAVSGAVELVDHDLDDPASGRRTIRGTIVLWDTPGSTSVGPTVFARGSVKLPDDLKRVKLLFDHDHSRPVGYATAAVVTARGIDAEFYVPEGDLGDLALAQARDGLRDALSVGSYIDDYGFDGAERVVVKASRLHEVSLVAVPAFPDALVSGVTATHNPNPAPIGASTMTDRPETSTEAETVETDTATAPEVERELVVTAAAGGDALDADAAAARATAEAVRSAPATTRPRTAPFTLQAMAAVVGKHLRAGGAPADVPRVVQAALADVTPANISDTPYGPVRPQYVDDLWLAADVSRPTLDAFGPTRKLTSMSVQGWVWETRPVVATYAGNKAEVPSNPIKRVRQENDAQRFAGGWDVDRIFVDLPTETDEIADIFVEATRSYAEQSEAYAASTIDAAATLLYGDPVTVPAALAVIGSYFAKLKGSRLGYVTMGVDAWDDFANMTESSAPWWLRSLGSLSLTESSGEVAGLRFTVNPDLAPTQIVAADKRAARFWEIDPPVRVQALDVARGGVDIGVFGYVAGMVTDPRAVVNLDTAGRTEP